MRSATILWYYIVLALIVIAALIFVDFSNLALTIKLVLILALVLLVANPIITVWIFGRREVAPRDTSAKLKTQVAKLTTEVNHLRELDKNKSEFVLMTAHQLRTPLSAIKWTFHMIMNGDLGPVTPDQRSFLKKGYDSAGKVIAVVNNWLDLDYVQANKNKYQFIPTDIPELIDSVAAEFHQRAREKNLDLVVVGPKVDIPKVEVDPIKFSMIMENLIDNAVKYTRAGGKIMVTTKSNGPNLEIVVADTGIGIPKVEQEKLFQQFFRADNAATASPRGSGLGLFIVKNLVEGHGGTIRLESEEKQGTKFTVAIPLKQNKV